MFNSFEEPIKNDQEDSSEEVQGLLEEAPVENEPDVESSNQSEKREVIDREPVSEKRVHGLGKLFKQSTAIFGVVMMAASSKGSAAEDPAHISPVDTSAIATKSYEPKVDKYPYNLKDQLVPENAKEVDGVPSWKEKYIKPSLERKEIGSYSRSNWSLESNILIQESDGGFSFKFNPYTILMPVQFKRTEDMGALNEVRITAPMHYARMFNNAEALNREEDRERVKEYVKSEIYRIIADRVAGLGLDHDKDSSLVATFGEDVNPHPVQITNMKITGFAGPTGHASDGPESSMPGEENIDESNVILGGARALEGASMVQEVLNDKDVIQQLEAQGVDRMELKAVFEKALEGIKGYEDQFSQDEIKILLSIADAHGYQGTDAEKVFTVDHNFDRETEEGTFTAVEEKILSGIIGTKRRAEISITYKDGQENTLIVPLPLLPLLLLPLAKILFESSSPGKEEGPPKDPKERKINPPKLRVPKIPIKLPPTTEIIGNDLYPYFGHSKNEEGGLDYDEMVTRAEAIFLDGSTIKEVETELTQDILASWRVLDTQNRAAALREEDGSLPDGWDAGLSYEYSDHQQEYAKMHAQMLRIMIETKQLDKKWSDEYGWEPEVELDRNGSPYRGYINELAQILDLQDIDENGNDRDPKEVLQDRGNELYQRAQEGDARAVRELEIMQEWFKEDSVE